MGTVSGRPAQMIERGALILLMIIVIAIVVLTIGGANVPPEISLIVTTLLGFLFGTRVNPSDDQPPKEPPYGES